MRVQCGGCGGQGMVLRFFMSTVTDAEGSTGIAINCALCGGDGWLPATDTEPDEPS